MLYNAFTGTSSLADAAWSIAQLIFRKLNVAGDAVSLYNSLLWKFRAIYNSFGGNFSWADLGGVILDLGEFILSLTPAGKIADIISVLWGSANIL
ncbi:hypothetical protein ABEW34_09690 [Paenibacillus algorifonticola]|uniref:Uncharacterized protein n=1 Tax=Paenibacillus sp. BIHB 4019 TaxID=1870819 RepID=A0A1B2DL26_9BACL|nr:MULTISPECIES: hypothetical protein [unclassified Paenibacillus]ANY68407.1 hypothetical protein BBD42_19465 [Paenibacillus sp. BIHB 4019]